MISALLQLLGRCQWPCMGRGERRQISFFVLFCTFSHSDGPAAAVPLAWRDTDVPGGLVQNALIRILKRSSTATDLERECTNVGGREQEARESVFE